LQTKPPLPPFTPETAAHKVRLAEDAWNSRDPDRVVQVYTEDTRWRNRAEFPVGREQVRAFLQRMWARELDYRLVKELWACAGHRIAVRFAYEWHDDSDQWFRSYGNENWEFDPAASCNGATPASTTCGSAPTTACSTGRRGAVRTHTRASPNWGSEWARRVVNGHGLLASGHGVREIGAQLRNHPFVFLVSRARARTDH